METLVQNTLPESMEASMPWLTFKLADRIFAVHSSTIETIFQLDQHISDMPELSGNMKGIINLRGKIIPLMDLRGVLGIESFEQELYEFSSMLDDRKQDHLDWVAELKRCVSEDCDFTLATDPHKCAFGKWYYGFETNNNNIRFQLKKIEEPHSRLHESANAVFNCSKQHDKCQRKICVKTVLAEQADVYVKTVLDLIEQAKQTFHDDFKQMCIVINDGTSDLGLLVDEVLSVGTLDIMQQDEQLNDLYHTQIVKHIAKAAQGDSQILVLDHNTLFSLAK